MQKLSFLIMLVLLSGLLRGQSSLYLTPNASLFIGPGTPLTVDSLVLTPAAAYTITGANSIQRSTATLHGGSSPYIRRVYQWTNTLPPFTGSLTFYYRDSELNGIDEGQLTLNVHNGTNWSAYINNVIRNSTNNVVTTTLTGVALNELTLTSVQQSPLPMVWLDVAAQRRNSVIQISWQTAEESNCAGYQVEKSANGIDWSRLGAVINAYNTPGPNHYIQTDPTLPTAISFYRVRQADLDGKYGYSKMVSVKSDKSNEVWLYPIPANNVLTIVAGSNLGLKSVMLYNTAGALVAALQPKSTSHTMDVHHLASGNYTAVIVLSDNSTITRNFIIQ